MIGLIGNPSLFLEGKTLDGGWAVGKQIPIGLSTSAGTGGNFTVAYHLVGKDGKGAFLKALDYSRPMNSPNPSEELYKITAAYRFECAVLEKCGQGNLDRIVKALASGTITIDEPTAKGIVEYLVFELADGDVRKHLNTFSQKFDIAWRLRALHHIATGLKQLHTNGIAHQDLKPSNVLVFDKKTSKLADLGRASFQGHSPRHDQYTVAGDPSYAPIDLTYGYSFPEWHTRRLSCDVYHLGSMIVFFFTGVSMTPLILKHLDPQFQPRYFGGGWNGSFEDVLDYVREAFEKAVEEFGSQILDPRLKVKLTEILRQLCDPDVRKRGHPKTMSSNGNSFDLERYIQEFNILAYRAEIGMTKE